MKLVATKFQTAAAACAVAAAATVVPAAAVHAAPELSAPAAPVVQLLNDVKLSPASLLGGGLAQDTTSWWLYYFGAPRADAPPRTTLFSFQPLAFVPGFLRPFFGWFESLNFEACFLGFSVKVGPYGTISGSVGRGC